MHSSFADQTSGEKIEAVGRVTIPKLHRSRRTNPGNVHSQSIDLKVAPGNEGSGTAVGTVPIYTPARRYIARKTTLRIANHLVLFIVIYRAPDISIRVRQDADRNRRLYSGYSNEKKRSLQRKWKLLVDSFSSAFS